MKTFKHIYTTYIKHVNTCENVQTHVQTYITPMKAYKHIYETCTNLYKTCNTHLKTCKTHATTHKTYVTPIIIHIYIYICITPIITYIKHVKHRS